MRNNRDTFIYVAFVIVISVSFIANRVAQRDKEQNRKIDSALRNQVITNQNQEDVIVKKVRYNSIQLKNPKNLKRVFPENEIVPEEIGNEEE